MAISSGTLAFSRSDNVSFGGNISGCGQPRQAGNERADADRHEHLRRRNDDQRRHVDDRQRRHVGEHCRKRDDQQRHAGLLPFRRHEFQRQYRRQRRGDQVRHEPPESRGEQLRRPHDRGGRDARTGANAELHIEPRRRDLQAGKIVFDYAGGADPAATIQGLLNASYDNGLWDVGQFKDTTATATGLTLGCLDNPSTHTVTVMATYPGDFNLDGVVDNLDKVIWFANAFSGTTWQQGDANRDGVVDGLDRDLWSAHAGLMAPTQRHVALLLRRHVPRARARNAGLVGRWSDRPAGLQLEKKESASA